MRRQEKICILGLGTVGLPLACSLAAASYHVLGVDINDKVLAKVASAEPLSSEPGLCGMLQVVLQKGFLRVSKCPEPSDIFIVAVPTPLDANKKPRLCFLHAAIKSIQPHLQPKNLVIIESTCPIGTTAVVAGQLRERCLQAHVAYCPERVLPGDLLNELIINDRIVGGVDEASTELARSFYQSFVKGQVLTTDSRTAEAVKLAENSFRDVNLAYANELSMIADHVGVDVYEVIKLANRHPRVEILNPGPGVGGYCIPVNPWLLASSAPELVKLLPAARAVNCHKTEWIIQKLQKIISDKDIQTVACLGLTYKANVCDTRDSAALAIVQELEKQVRVLRVDPYVPHSIGLEEALNKAQMVVVLVAHHDFLNISRTALSSKVFLDFAGIF